MANSHPGSYCGQDAYNDMLITENRNGLRNRKRTTRPVESAQCDRSIELYARSTGNFEGGCNEMDENVQTIVRRLTPMECERLQGFPDGWTDIGEWIDSKGRVRQTVDSARYKALGNSVALPYWKVLARRIAAQYDRDITMGSLFDGIGGFPLAFEHCGAKAVWASEIEDFCIAVTKKHFPEDEQECVNKPDN